MEIAFEEKISDLTDKNLAFMIEALNIQMRDHYCKAWNQEHWPCKAYKSIRDLPVGTFWPIAILPSLDISGVAGYHDFAAGFVYGRVRWDGSFNGTALTASHEAIELRGDPYCNKWVDIGGGRKVAFEKCDPCQGDSYEIEVKIFGEIRKVKVSDFVLPSYFKKDGKRPFTFLDTIDENVFSLGLSRNGGGYLITQKNGVVSDYWGKKRFFGKVQPPLTFTKDQDPLSRHSKRVGTNADIVSI
jgi:hypothetical protein